MAQWIELGKDKINLDQVVMIEPLADGRVRLHFAAGAFPLPLKSDCGEDVMVSYRDYAAEESAFLCRIFARSIQPV